MKPGWKTSEFWTAALAALVPVVNEHMGVQLDTNTLMIIYAPLVTYILGRMVVKVKANSGTKTIEPESTK